MHFDLTALARHYGLMRVPPVVFNDNESDGEASFDPEDWTIYYGRHFIRRAGDSYDQERFRSAGVGRLDHADAMRFVLAHELWHAMQFQQDPRRAFRRTEALEYDEQIERMLGEQDSHDSDRDEREADQHAARAYKLVQILA